MHRAVLCIGSNVSGARRLIEHALECLTDSGAEVMSRSDIYTVNLPYYNCVAKLATDLDVSGLVSLTKEIEIAMGRTKAMKALSVVPIDIDVVLFDDATLRPSDYDADYFIRGYSRVANL